MIPTSTALYHYTKPRIDMLEPRKLEDGSYPLWEDDVSMRALTQDTYVAWRQLEPILARITGVLGTDQFTDSPPFSLPARIELIRTQDHSNLQGLVLFDSQGQLIVHVVHALLGYEGSGTKISEQILGYLGVSEAMFREIQQNVQNRPYLIILSRQKHELHEDVRVSNLTPEVEEEWRYWDVSERLDE